MEVLVNQRNVDFTLEGEQTVGEVVQELLKWLRDNAMAVTGVTVDNEQLPLAGTSTVANRDLSSVGRIEVEALTDQELSATAFATARDYFRMLHSALAEGQNELYSELAPQFAELRPTLSQRLPEVLDPNGSAGVDLIAHYQTEPPAGTERERLIESADQVRRIAESRLREITDPEREIANTAAVLSELLPQLSDASVLLQTGKEHDAMSLVYRFSELASKVLRLLPRALPETAEQVGTEELHGALSELLSAFESGDTVLIGDLIEYELVPKTETVLGAVHEAGATPDNGAANPPDDARGDGPMG